MATSDWTVYARDANRRRLGVIEDYQRLELRARFNTIGTWLIDVDGRSPAAQLLRQAEGIEVVRDGTGMLAGPISQATRTVDNDDRFEVGGVDDLVWLDRRVIAPVPAGPPYTAQAYDVQSGPAETVIRYYVDANAGPGATSPRRVAGLTLAADQARGTTVAWGRGRFHPLLASIAEIAVAGGGLGFRVRQDGDDLIFEVYEPADRTATAVFSRELGNLAGWTHAIQAPAVNYAIAGGAGEGTARLFDEGGDSESISTWGRTEAFVDQRHTADVAELAQLRTTHLAENGERTGLSLSPVDTDGLQFLRDYNLGDRVTVVIDTRRATREVVDDTIPATITPYIGLTRDVEEVSTETIQDVIREVVIVLDADAGETVTPSVATPGDQQPIPTARRLSSVEARLTRLERI